MSRWVENLRRGSPGTADVYLRRLGAICQRVGKTPTQLADLDEGAAYRLLLDFVTSEEKRGATGSFISHSVTVARSWLTHNGKPQVRRIKIRAPDSAPTLQDERVPEQAELRRVLLAAPAQWRAAASVMAFGGARPEVLGNYLGTDGLRLRDLPDLRLSGTTVAFERMPARVDVRPELSKAGHKYLTFLGTEACGYIVEYLAERLRAGESLDRNSDLIHPLRAPKPFIRAVNIGDGVRSAIRRAGFPWRPYVLRAYFDTQLLLAESKGKIAHDYRVFWMGHKGSMEARYTTNKGRLPESLLDDMRESYRRAEPFLATAVDRRRAGEGQPMDPSRATQRQGLHRGGSRPNGSRVGRRAPTRRAPLCASVPLAWTVSADREANRLIGRPSRVGAWRARASAGNRRIRAAQLSGRWVDC